MYKKIRNLFICIILLASTKLLAVNCGDFGDVVAYNGHYYALTAEKFTFGQAKQLAEANLGYLAIPNSAAENAWLETTFGIGWIGILDSGFSSGYCTSLPCPTNPSRFLTVNGQAPTYTNWGAGQPDNYISAYDVGRVSIVGEHFAVLTQNGFWASEGDHFEENNYPKQYKAILEFDTKPVCYNEPPTQSQVIDTASRQVCTNGSDYSLAECISGDYNATTTCANGASLSGTTCSYSGSCPSGTNLPSNCSGTYSNTWLKDMYITLLNRCPDQAGYNYWLSDINRYGYTSSSQLEPAFCEAARRNNEPCRSNTPDPNTCYGTDLQDVTVQQPVTTRSPLQCPSGGTLSGTTCNRTCTSTTYSCPNGSALSGTRCSYTASSSTSYACPSRGTLSGTTCSYNATPSTTYSCPSGGTLNGTTCSTTSSPTLYQATCPSGYSMTLNDQCVKSTNHTLPYTCPAGTTPVYYNWAPTKVYCYYPYVSVQCPSGGSAVQGRGTDFGGASAYLTWWCYSAGTTSSYNATPSTTYSCPSGGTLNGTTCTYNASSTPSYSCPSGGTLSGTTCSYNATPNYSNYDCSYSGSCPSGTNLPSNCSGTYSNTWLKDMYITLLNRCPDQAGYNYWLSDINRYGYTSSSQLEPAFCEAARRNNEPCRSNTPTNCSGNYPNEWLKNMFLTLLGRCPDQAGYNYWLSDINRYGYTSSSQLEPAFCEAARRNNEPCRSNTPDPNTCYGTDLQDVTVQQPVTTRSPLQCPSGGTLSGTTCSYNATLGCPSGGALNGSICTNGAVCPLGDYQCISNAQIENEELTITDARDQGFQDDGSCAGQIRLFNGKTLQCRSRDVLFGLLGGGCCQRGTPDGLGGLFAVQCSADEKLLSKYRQETKDKSHYIGDYCSRRVNLGLARICVQTKQSYCVFNSKLARLIHEQGRAQIGIDWGVPRSPNCKGFTPEEFQKIDFSKLDLSEFYGDLESRITTTFDTRVGATIQQKLSDFGVNINGN